MVDKDNVDKTTFDAFSETVENEFGIEFTWGEKAALKHYMESFGNLADSGQHPIDPYNEALQWFLIDYFGLDRCELGGGNLRPQ